MITAEKTLRDITAKVSVKTGIDISFVHGRTETVINYITRVINSKKVYPAIILFTEGIIEKKTAFYYEFYIPKIAICTTTVQDATEKQRLESNFENIIFPIFEVLEKELKMLHLGYDLVINRTDIPYMQGKNSNENQFHQLVDGCLIKNLRIMVNLDMCKRPIFYGRK